MLDGLRYAFVQRCVRRMADKLDDAFDVGDLARVRNIEAQINQLTALLRILERRISLAKSRGE